MKSASETLIAAKALIEDEAHWTRKAYARNQAGKPVPTVNETACQFCAIGALNRAGHTWEAGSQLERQARKMGFHGVFSLNDYGDHSLVMKMFKLAIEDAQAKERKDAQQVQPKES